MPDRNDFAGSTNRSLGTAKRSGNNLLPRPWMVGYTNSRYSLTRPAGISACARLMLPVVSSDCCGQYPRKSSNVRRGTHRCSVGVGLALG
jgi:hypothetical protein